MTTAEATRLHRRWVLVWNTVSGAEFVAWATSGEDFTILSVDTDANKVLDARILEIVEDPLPAALIPEA
jgi:hypothetical protein